MRKVVVGCVHEDRDAGQVPGLDPIAVKVEDDWDSVVTFGCSYRNCGLDGVLVSRSETSVIITIRPPVCALLFTCAVPIVPRALLARLRLLRFAVGPYWRG